jgi:hypothetical protein
MTKKITKRERFEKMLEKYDFTAEEREFIEHEIFLLAKKSSGEKKPTKTQIANMGLKEVILEVLAEAESPMTISELIKADERLAEYSTQKIAPLMTALVKEFKVVRIEEKRKAYFKIV